MYRINNNIKTITCTNERAKNKTLRCLTDSSAGNFQLRLSNYEKSKTLFS